MPTHRLVIEVQTRRLASRVAGRFEFRVHGEEEPFTTLPWKTWGGAQAGNISMTIVGPVDVDRDDLRLDVRFTPDLRLAFEAGFSNCFGGELAWNDVSLTPRDACDSPQMRRPDAVTRWVDVSESESVE